MSGRNVILEWNIKRGFFWLWGNETFYDDERRMITFDDMDTARDWRQANHPELYETPPKKPDNMQPYDDDDSWMNPLQGRLGI